eukprot:CAMPEP_0179156002 /NCGR_PEP_ID=MMETSP0796-20121207/76025_1 /TAXON_ID=73915 /ORGANISM="Pyrodinium bahamense, Strain pbaha01" /LENGTH=147 /DNA_ID=CAMNT_0020857539 /DNA_START=294 /DNA_END=734 /DNA_ORIENTATION=+
MDDGGVGSKYQDANPTAQHSAEHQQWHSEVDNVPHDPCLAAPPNQQARQPIQATPPAPRLLAVLAVISVLGFVQGVDGLVGTPQGQEGFPHRDCEQAQHQHCNHLALLLDLIADLVEEPTLTLQRQEVRRAENKGQPDECHPNRDTS